MDPRYRERFNAQITPELYGWYQRELSRRLECSIDFRLAETPVFLPDDLKAKLVAGSQAIVAQLSDPATIARMKHAIPERWNVPGMDTPELHPGRLRHRALTGIPGLRG